MIVKQKIFKISLALLILTIIATTTIGVLMVCKVLKVSFDGFKWLGLSLYVESIALYFTKKPKKNDTDD